MRKQVAQPQTHATSIAQTGSQGAQALETAASSPFIILNQDRWGARSTIMQAKRGPLTHAHLDGFLGRLQRTMGNRYVQRSLAFARQEEREGEAIPEVDSLVEKMRGGGPVLQRQSDSSHPEEQDAEDASKDPETPCKELIKQIEALIEVLAGRLADLVKHKGGDAGHRERFQTVQKILKALMTMAVMACKNGEYDSELAEEAEKWATKPLPFMSVEPDSEPSLREKIAEALRKAGVPAWAVAGLVVTIIAILADPEPFSKVAGLIGLAAAVAFFILIGRQSDVPSGTTTASVTTANADGKSAA